MLSLGEEGSESTGQMLVAMPEKQQVAIEVPVSAHHEENP